MKKQVLAAVLGIAVAGLSMWPATAAPDATLNAAAREYKWTGGPFVMVNPGNQADMPCLTPELESQACDIKYIQADVAATGGTIEISLTMQLQDDFDLYIYDEKGRELGHSAGDLPGDPEKVRLRLSKPTTLKVAVTKFLNVASSYEGVAKLV